MSLTLPELACVVAIGVAAVQLPHRDGPQPRFDGVKRPLIAVRTDRLPASSEPTRAAPSGAAAETKERTSR